VALGDDLWRACHVLRHQGVDYGEYVDQLANVLSIRLLSDRAADVHDAWADLSSGGPGLVARYSKWLDQLGAQTGAVGELFRTSQNLFVDDHALARVLDLVRDAVPGPNTSQVIATTFEDLLRRAASEGKKGAGQYFTPEFVTQAMVEALRPAPEDGSDTSFVVSDPAAGVGGFLIAAQRWMKETEGTGSSHVTYEGTEIAHRPARLARINLLAHETSGAIRVADALSPTTHHAKADVVLTNPPFGLQGGTRAASFGHFAFPTSSKQLAFLQLARAQLKDGGRAAIVLPDSALENERTKDLWRAIGEDAALHTLLRLPLRTFAPYAPSIRTSVVFMHAGRQADTTWVFDCRTPETVMDRARRTDLVRDFTQAFGARPDGTSARHEAICASGTWSEHPANEVFGTLLPQARVDAFEAPVADSRAPLRSAVLELEGALKQLSTLLGET
jgi:type I restriction enzyme M protein